MMIKSIKLWPELLTYEISIIFSMLSFEKKKKEEKKRGLVPCESKLYVSNPRCSMNIISLCTLLLLTTFSKFEHGFSV